MESVAEEARASDQPPLLGALNICVIATYVRQAARDRQEPLYIQYMCAYSMGRSGCTKRRRLLASQEAGPLCVFAHLELSSASCNCGAEVDKRA